MKNNFKGNAKGKKGKVKMTTKKKPKAFVEAEEDVERYMKELGLDII